MNMGIIGIVDYGVGNLRSISGAVRKLGYEPCISQDPKNLKSARRLILPGVGAFGDGMAGLQQTGMDDFLKEAVLQDGIPILGICLGAQLLTRGSEEFGWHSGLNFIEGEVKSLSSFGCSERIPHIGWNEINLFPSSRLLTDIKSGDLVYFVHSLGMLLDKPENVKATCSYGFEFVAAFEKENIYGVQFHPEKSQAIGLKVLGNFLMDK